MNRSALERLRRAALTRVFFHLAVLSAASAVLLAALALPGAAVLGGATPGAAPSPPADARDGGNVLAAKAEELFPPGPKDWGTGAPAGAGRRTPEPASSAAAGGLGKQHVAAPKGAPPAGGELMVEVTGYSQSAEEGTANGVTASELPADLGMAAADPAVIPLGTLLHVPGYGYALVGDIGGGVRGRQVDLFFPTREEAFLWGRKLVTVRVVGHLNLPGARW